MAFDFKSIDFKKFDWHALKKITSPQGANDLNRFLEKMPGTVGQTPLVAVGIAWAVAGAIGLFTTIQVKSLTTLRQSLKETKALQPVVPKIKDVPISPGDLKTFVDTLSSLYPDLVVKQQGAEISISAKTTANFAEFREAIGHVQNGGSGWRVNIDKLCVGRECAHDQLDVLLKISKVSVDKPQ